MLFRVRFLYWNLNQSIGALTDIFYVIPNSKKKLVYGGKRKTVLHTKLNIYNIVTSFSRPITKSSKLSVA